MPRGPQGQKRPADSIGAAVQVARIAIGEEEETPISVQTADQILGRKGGQARARKLASAQRQAIARQGAAMRWAAKGHD